MTLEEMLAKEKNQKSKRKHNDEEHRIQCSCIRWFRIQYPKMGKVLFAIPNGGSRNKIEAARLNGEGVTAGVADLILLKCNRFYGALCIEMKTTNGLQSSTQKKWQKAAENAGNKYVICRSLEDFIQEINNYLKDL